MDSEQAPSMHHFSSKDAYHAFVEELAAAEAETIQEWGAYEVSTDVVAQVEDRSTDIQVNCGSAPHLDGIDAPVCPITVLEYSESMSGLPCDEVESISQLAAELLEQDLEQELAT